MRVDAVEPRFIETAPAGGATYLTTHCHATVRKAAQGAERLSGLMVGRTGIAGADRMHFAPVASYGGRRW